MARKALNIGVFLVILLLFFEAVRIISNGWIPFWYDPGRDLLLARDNLHKLSFIGPPSGIPGVFYLPYWTWLGSLGLLFSKDPRIITLLTTTVPYFLILPFAFKKLSKIFGSLISFSLLIIFLLSFQNLSTQFWSPNLAPVLFMALALAVVTKKYFVAGILAGLGVGFNMGFGIGIMFLTSIYLMFTLRKQIFSFVRYIGGLGLVFVPFLIFEIRHGGNQFQSLLGTIFSSPVNLSGLSRQQLIMETLKTAGHIAPLPIMIVIAVIATYMIFKKRVIISPLQKSLFYYLVFCLVGLMTIYFFSKNPKWDYHFVGMEIIFLMLLGLFLKWARLSKLIILWVIVLFSGYFILGTRPDKNDYKQNLYLWQKQAVVETIINDARTKDFTVRAYNPAIYTYDYDYLFWQRGRSPVENSDLVYLIIPPTSMKTRDDFIEAKTPSVKFHTGSTWEFADKTAIIRREI